MKSADLAAIARQSAARQEGRGHICCFDYLRLFAMSGVIFMHMASSLLRGELTPGWHGANFLTSLSFTAVPLFFMMSGTLLLSSARTTDLKLLWRKRIPRLLFPLLFWSALWILIARVWGGKTADESWKSLLAVPHTSAYAGLWYMYTLIALYVISPFLYYMVQGMDRRASRYLVGLITAIMALDMIRTLAPGEIRQYLKLDLESSLRFLNTNLFPFLLGFFLFRWKRRIAAWKLVVLSLFCLAVIVVGTWLRTRQSGIYDASFQAQTGGWEIALACLLFLLAKQYLRRPLRLQLSRELVQLSLPIYLMHNPLKYLLWRDGIYPTRFLNLLPICVLVLAVCYLISKTLSSVPGLGWISVGIPWAEAQKSCSWQASFCRLWQRLGKGRAAAQPPQ